MKTTVIILLGAILCFCQQYPFDTLSASPNPFNPSTVISVSLTSKEFVILQIFDVSGKLIKTIVKKEMVAGRYSFNFSVTNFASGVYLARLTTGNKVYNKRLILMR